MEKKDLLLYGGIAVGGYLVYMWLRDSGMLAQFGIPSTTVPTGVSTSTTLAQTQQVAPSNNTSYPSVYVQPPVTATVVTPTSDTKTRMLAVSAGDPAINNSLSSIDVWNYCYGAVTGVPLTSSQIVQAFPYISATERGNITVDGFLNAIGKIGLSGVSGVGAIVNVPQVPSVPGMNFGGGRNAFSSRRGGGWLN